MIDSYLRWKLKGWTWNYRFTADNVWRLDAHNTRNISYRYTAVDNSRLGMAFIAAKSVRRLNREIYLAEKTVV